MFSTRPVDRRFVSNNLLQMIGAKMRLRPNSRIRAHERMIRSERLTANLEGEFAVFLIGMRINKPLKVHKWLPVVRAMPRMLKELYQHPELGFIHSETWFSRTIILVQYWRSMEQLLAYAKSKSSEHLPAWHAFNKSVGTDGSVGVWHETYAASPGTYESIYINMPPFGLGKAGALTPASGGRQSAAGRLDMNAL